MYPGACCGKDCDLCEVFGMEISDRDFCGGLGGSGYYVVIADIPFYVITWSLTIILILSAAIVALAWAYQNNW